ncbi:hypothetical protein PFICI_14544 [Pestalotiopsis fici W106-1]|uniref:Uncharacterized protein n=1 Tax=Pestalotiopsis fici (strain W106-1 / CGMCC3.15140) TaxID=1229662 RepID=W3WI82_PESFW|nr:uncharacterized protein PFICI_14544 [Pestalotiopsis fici W106-1]ETS73598.1 hypothetical protein PFICI_14544 [Pestalotiopsis fici W106-1]
MPMSPWPLFRQPLHMKPIKLPALAGSAEIFRRATGNTYVAGLWRETLLVDLCWYRKDFRSEKNSSSQNAPSWSWASVDGGVEYDHDLYRKPPKVLNTITKFGTLLNVAYEAITVDNLSRHTWVVELEASLVPPNRIVPVFDKYEDEALSSTWVIANSVPALYQMDVWTCMALNPYSSFLWHLEATLATGSC